MLTLIFLGGSFIIILIRLYFFNHTIFNSNLIIQNLLPGVEIHVYVL